MPLTAGTQTAGYVTNDVTKQPNHNDGVAQGIERIGGPGRDRTDDLPGSPGRAQPLAFELCISS